MGPKYGRRKVVTPAKHMITNRYTWEWTNFHYETFIILNNNTPFLSFATTKVNFHRNPSLMGPLFSHSLDKVLYPACTILFYFLLFCCISCLFVLLICFLIDLFPHFWGFKSLSFRRQIWYFFFINH